MDHVVVGMRLALALLENDWHAFTLTLDEAGDCSGCLRALVRAQSATLALLMAQVEGRDNSILQVQSVLIEELMQ
ncbi:Mycobacterium numidiamassiliense ORFan [Mycobacterium numidiamassiliense]|uniref:Mycobacterium numidiamassiliense ORFan n=1 Tax=Mycobacterium numidiamassiliense TaxID=1841861 RepID=A0A2U3P9T9_9MYCO|nr:hypothetical protein [Mycobacterium numidiamassiliense]SPM40519.1 Mycobacterium numidiamassiliense ORFan [Mycobacterium numidiamassiliense]